jgi:hypothetical protein
MVFSLTHAAEAAMFVLLAATDPENARSYVKNAAEESQRAVRPIEILNSGDAMKMTEAARKDYDTLLRKYGEHDEVVIGDPVDCFDDE